MDCVTMPAHSEEYIATKESILETLYHIYRPAVPSEGGSGCLLTKTAFGTKIPGSTTRFFCSPPPSPPPPIYELSSEDTATRKPTANAANAYTSMQTTENQLTGVAAALGGMFISHNTAVMDLILGGTAALPVRWYVGQKCGGGPAGDAQFQSGRAGGDAPVQIVDPGGGLEEVGGFVQGHG